MSIESYAHAMPAVDLHVHLEGAFQKDTLEVIADLNEIRDSFTDVDFWLQSLENPDYEQLNELIQSVSQWIRHPEDLARIVYDLGIHLAKDNVRYAEVSINPVPYLENGFTLETFFAAITDGRSRVERGWPVRLAWILTMSRDEPRRADEIVRFATSPAARNQGVVALGLDGSEETQPVGQFERAFKTAEKKDLPIAPHTGETLGVQGVIELLDELTPDRIMDGWGLLDSTEALSTIVNTPVSLATSLTRAVRSGQVIEYKAYPLRRLFDEDVKVVLGADHLHLIGTTLSDEYLHAVKDCGLSIDELNEIALNAVRYSYLPEEDKSAMIEKFVADYSRLNDEHISSELTA